MKAAYSRSYGPPEALRIVDFPRPTIKKDEILVNVRFSTFNRTDCGVRRAKPFIIRFFVGLRRPNHPISGTNFSGDVVEVGENVKGFQVGDRVFGFNDHGLSGHAELASVKVDGKTQKIPENVTYEQAVAATEGAHYAYFYIQKIKELGARRVLVNGATGAIGSAAVQLLLDEGIEVVATANTKNMDLIRSLGPEYVVNYETEDFTQLDDRFDIVFDSVGKSSFGPCRKILNPEGAYMSSELGPGAENLYLPLITKIKGGQRVYFPVPGKIGTSMEYITEKLAEGKLKPLIDRTYPLDEIVEAFRFAESGQKTGNVLIKIA